MQVRIKYPYYLANEDFDRLSASKQHYWMKCMESDKFINYCKFEEKPPCNAPVDITVDLPCGTYLMGAGDRNVKRLHMPAGIKGEWSARCLIWFYVANDGAHVVHSNDLPSMADIDAYNASLSDKNATSAPVNPDNTKQNDVQAPEPAETTADTGPKTSEPATKSASCTDDTEIPLPGVIFLRVDDAWYCAHDGFSVLESSPVCESFEFAPEKGAERTCANCVYAQALYAKSKSV